MIEGIEAVTVNALSMAMDAATLRQQAIATNIANADTVGFEPLSVSFEDQLEDARMALQGQGRLDAASLGGVTPRLEIDRSSRTLGVSPKVMIDMEVAHMAQNAVQYQALAKGLSKHFAILSSAISDGKK